jgi:hypothetical protein
MINAARPVIAKDRLAAATIIAASVATVKSADWR